MGGTPNYYEILGCNLESTQKEILKAYRKKALSCHPDKNPDNPKAAELFIEISEAFKVLTDTDAKAAFDKILRAREKAKLRTQAFDAKRKKFKQDLEQRESAAQNEKETEGQAAERLAAEIKRLREEGSRLLKEQQELIEQQLKEEAKKKEKEEILPKLRVKWKAKKNDHQNGGYHDSILMEIFQQFGTVTGIVVSTKKNGLAIIEYSKSSAANMAIEFAKGLEENPITVSWLVEPTQPEPESNATVNENKIPQSSEHVTSNHGNQEDFEALVLKRMRQAEKRKRLNEELKEKEDT